MENEEQSEAVETHFDDKYVYYQWLVARKAMPYGFNRFIVNGMWALYLGFLIFDYPSYFVLIYDVNFLIIAGIPLALISLDFLYFTPRLIHDDVGTRALDVLFTCPVSTSDIFSDVRRFIVRLNFPKLMPFLLIFAIQFFRSGLHRAVTPFGVESMMNRLGDVTVFIALCWLMLEMGILIAALPKQATYLAVNLLIVALLGYVALYKYRFIFGSMWALMLPGTGIIKWVFSGMYKGMAGYNPVLTELFWPFMSWLLIMRLLTLIIPAIIFHYSQPVLFKRLRNGEWR